MSLVYHERPGVYSSYDASSIIARGSTERVIALIGKAEAKAGLYRLHSYAEAKEAFAEGSELGRMAKLAYQNGAGTVLASPVAEDTLEAYQAALALADLPLPEDYCVEMPTLGSDDAAVHALLSRADRPTAIVVSDDLLGMTLGRACLAHGLSIPKDISIISFNNSLFAKLTSPRLTSVDLNSFQLGIEAASQLISHVERPELMATKSIIPHRIVERESCRDL